MNNNYQITEQEEKDRIERKKNKSINSLGEALQSILKDVKEMQRSQEKVEEYKRIINISNHDYDYTYEHLENTDVTKERHLKNPFDYAFGGIPCSDFDGDK